MINAAPGEDLNFEYPERDDNNDKVVVHVPDSMGKKLSVKRKGLKKQAIEDLKKKIVEKHQELREREKAWRDFTPPRYDEIYFEGVEWVETLAGEPLGPEEGMLDIPDEFWKSEFRTDDELS
ncbi:MAG: hypothetical protein JRJ85_23790 [Deltaproteobacteria bacterium]|nr:hypothetical protein [Deltaproteobacteria bacterium]